MIRILSAACTVLMLSASPVLAQSATDPAAAAAVRELMQQTNFRQLMTQAYSAMESQLEPMMMEQAEAELGKGKHMTPAQRAEALAKVKQKVPAAVAVIRGVLTDPRLLSEVEQATIPIYTKHFTVDEIKQLTALYQSPLGKKMLEKMPLILSDSMEMGQRILMPPMTKAMEDHFAKNK